MSLPGWMSRGSGQGDTNRKSEDRDVSGLCDEELASTRRNGKFYNLSTFMVMPEKFTPTFTHASLLNLKPGSIIYISDKTKGGIDCGETRLNKRVMLVLRARSSATLTCLTFCAHSQPTDSSDHLRVCEAGSSIQEAGGPNSNMTPFEINLHPNWPAMTRPQSGITINIGDFWCVETGVKAAVLGSVEPASMRALVKRVKELFCQSLDEAVPPRNMEPTSPRRTEAVIVQPNSSTKRSKKVYVKMRRKSNDKD